VPLTNKLETRLFETERVYHSVNNSSHVVNGDDQFL